MSVGLQNRGLGVRVPPLLPISLQVIEFNDLFFGATVRCFLGQAHERDNDLVSNADIAPEQHARPRHPIGHFAIFRIVMLVGRDEFSVSEGHAALRRAYGRRLA